MTSISHTDLHLRSFAPSALLTSDFEIFCPDFEFVCIHVHLWPNLFLISVHQRKSAVKRFGSSLCSSVSSVVRGFLHLALIRVHSRAFAAKLFLISAHQRESAVKR